MVFCVHQGGGQGRGSKRTVRVLSPNGNIVIKGILQTNTPKLSAVQVETLPIPLLSHGFTTCVVQRSIAVLQVPLRSAAISTAKVLQAPLLSSAK
jgi:hypothetical protein